MNHGKPIAHLVWRQGRIGVDDVIDYYEVATVNDKSVDGSDPFPVWMEPPSSAAALNAIAKALTEYRTGMAFIGTCGDGNCLIVKPEGQHTNGGCRCYSDKMKAQRAMARGKSLAAAIEAALGRAVS